MPVQILATQHLLFLPAKHLLALQTQFPPLCGDQFKYYRGKHRALETSLRGTSWPEDSQNRSVKKTADFKQW